MGRTEPSSDITGDPYGCSRKVAREYRFPRHYRVLRNTVAKRSLTVAAPHEARRRTWSRDREVAVVDAKDAVTLLR